MTVQSWPSMTIVTPLRKFESKRSCRFGIETPEWGAKKGTHYVRFAFSRTSVLRPLRKALEILAVSHDYEQRSDQAVHETGRADAEPEDRTHCERAEHRADRGVAGGDDGRNPHDGEGETCRPPQGEERSKQRRDAFAARKPRNGDQQCPATAARPAAAASGEPASSPAASVGKNPLRASSTRTAAAPRLPSVRKRIGRADVAACPRGAVGAEKYARDEYPERDRSDRKRAGHREDAERGVHADRLLVRHGPFAELEAQRNALEIGTPDRQRVSR